VGCNGPTSVYMQAVVEQGTWAFKKGVFTKSCSVMAWKRRHMIWPDAR
jgi:hypothetical protein